MFFVVSRSRLILVIRIRILRGLSIFQRVAAGNILWLLMLMVMFMLGGLTSSVSAATARVGSRRVGTGRESLCLCRFTGSTT